MQKYWVDERTRNNCFMLFPRGLSITWSEDPRFWTWKPLKEGRYYYLRSIIVNNRRQIRFCFRN
jgi:hypothetical protein